METGQFTSYNLTMRVAIAKWLPWINYSSDLTDGITDLRGPMAVLLQHFSNNLKVRFQFTEPPDGSWGKRLKNGSYNGMVGMVHRNEVDFAVGPFTMTQERAAVVRFTNPIYHDFVTILVGSQDEDKTLFLFLRVFQKWIWLATFVFVICSILAYIAVEKLVKVRERPVGIVDLVGKASVQFWALALSRRSTTSQNILLTSAMLGLTLLGWSLSGQLLSYMVINNPEEFIDSLEDFQKFPDVIPVLESGTSAESMFENSRSEAARYLWWTVLKNRSASLVPTKKFQTKEQMDIILTNTKYAAITEKTTVMALLSQRVNEKWKCGFHMTELKSFVKPMSVAIRNTLPNDISKVLTTCSNQMVESGLVVQYIITNSESYPLCLQILKEDGPTVLEFQDVAGILTIYCVGTLISICTCILEIGVTKFSKQTQNERILKKARRHSKVRHRNIPLT